MSKLGHEGTITYEAWPSFDESKLVDAEVEIVVQLNGKVRSKMMVSSEISREHLKHFVMEDEKVKELIDGKKTIRKVK